MSQHRTGSIGWTFSMPALKALTQTVNLLWTLRASSKENLIWLQPVRSCTSSGKRCRRNKRFPLAGEHPNSSPSESIDAEIRVLKSLEQCLILYFSGTFFALTRSFGICLSSRRQCTPNAIPILSRCLPFQASIPTVCPLDAVVTTKCPKNSNAAAP